MLGSSLRQCWIFFGYQTVIYIYIAVPVFWSPCPWNWPGKNFKSQRTWKNQERTGFWNTRNNPVLWFSEFLKKYPEPAGSLILWFFFKNAQSQPVLWFSDFFQKCPEPAGSLILWFFFQKCPEPAGSLILWFFFKNTQSQPVLWKIKELHNTAIYITWAR